MNAHIIDLCEELLIHGERVVLVTDENQCDYNRSIGHLKENEKFVYFSISMQRIQSDIRKILDVVN